TQMAGRAGRGDLAGQVLVQTYNPEHYALVHVSTHDTEGFTAKELAIREAAGTPPFSSHALVWVTSENDRAARRQAEMLTEAFGKAAARGVAVAGPAEAPIKRIAKRFRWMVQLRAPSVGPLHATLRAVLEAEAFRMPHDVRVAVDVDPYTVF
ncbi:MAG TPA: primosomal protein N', partial [bacterium]